MTIISYQKKLIFVKPRKVAGTTIEIFLSKYCKGENDIITRILEENLRTKLGYSGSKNYLSSNQKKFNFRLFYDFFLSFIKVIPGIKKLFTVNYPPNFKIWNGPFWIENFKFKEHEFIKDIKKKIDSKFFDEAFKITVVRNPYETFISQFFWQKHRGFISKETKFYEYTKNNCEFFFNQQKNIIFLNNDLPYNFIIKYENLIEDLVKLAKQIGINHSDIKGQLLKIQTKTNITKKNKFEILDNKSKKIIEKNARVFFEKFGYKKI